MGTRSIVVLEGKADQRQLYYHHFDGYPQNMVPIVDFVTCCVEVWKDDPFELVEERFHLVWNTYEKARALGGFRHDRADELFNKDWLHRIDHADIYPSDIEWTYVCRMVEDYSRLSFSTVREGYDWYGEEIEAWKEARGEPVYAVGR